MFPEIIHYPSAADGRTLFGRRWSKPEPLARLVLLHGIISHSGWYLASCRTLVEAGFEVHFLDRRGAGLNAAGRGDIDRFETWLTDVEGYLSHLPTDRPRLLAGISWGGKVATAVARRSPGLCDGLALLCPGLFARQRANRWQRLGIHAASLLGAGSRHVTIPLRDPALFTGEPHWQAYVATDPLTLRTITIRFARADLALSRYATESPESIRTPTFLMLAGRDRIIDNPSVSRFVESFAARYRDIQVYPEATHTFEFEKNAEVYCLDLARALQSLVEAVPAGLGFGRC